jgi:hypothetical protein
MTQCVQMLLDAHSCQSVTDEHCLECALRTLGARRVQRSRRGSRKKQPQDQLPQAIPSMIQAKCRRSTLNGATRSLVKLARTACLLEFSSELSCVVLFSFSTDGLLEPGECSRGRLQTRRSHPRTRKPVGRAHPHRGSRQTGLTLSKLDSPTDAEAALEFTEASPRHVAAYARSG